MPESGQGIPRGHGMKGEAIIGLAGSGLTESCLQRYHTLLQNHPPERIQVLVRSQRQGEQFFQRLQALEPHLIGPVRIETFLGFANRCLYEFWPQVRRHHPQIPASFGPTVLQKDLTQQILMETCSLCPRHVPIYDHKGLKPYQVWDQISSTAYIAGSAAIPPPEISPRLVQAWPDASDHRKVDQLGHVSCCVDRLYTACLDLASFDFGTLLLLFDQVILDLPEFWQELDHLIVDQADESFGVALRFYDKAQAQLQSVYLAYTIGGGLSFTGVPDAVASWIADHCTCQYLEQTHKSAPALTQLGIRLAEQMDPQFRLPFTLQPGSDPYPLEILEGETQLEAAEQMLGTVEKLRQEGVATSEIAILTPALDTGLALLIQKRMGEAVTVVRPFPALIKYPLARTFLTAAQLAHPHWGLFPSLSEGRLMLEIFLGMDPIRAQLLVEDTLDANAKSLRPAESVAYPERIGFANLERYQSLASWLQQYQSLPPPACGSVLELTLCSATLAALHQFRRSIPDTNPDRYRSPFSPHFSTTLRSRGD
ncbi:MAG: hypothetical protein HC921_00210 [Synechococcaceae cyanobacterium SM2_3_1]|nr:hypothetical protein [Synechococcaceae cyanobacterium SM2_3_1]